MARPSLSPQMTARIVEHLRDRELRRGDHLPSQTLADAFRVSRAPVVAALKALERPKVVRSEPNRGFFVVKGAQELAARKVPRAPSPDAGEALYLALAEDRLAGELADRVTESELMRRHGVPRSRLVKLLYRAADEGWIERLPGNGWSFRPVLTSRAAYDFIVTFDRMGG